VPQQQTNAQAPVQVGRRRFLQVGGLGMASAAVLAACAGSDGGGLARIGVAPTTTALPDPQVNDVVLLRTASSMERSIASVYDMIIGDSTYLDSSLDDLATRFRDDHQAHAELFEELTTDAGGEAWTCTNPRIDDFVIGPVFELIDGAPGTEDSLEIPPSDDAKRDVVAFIHALEAMAGATYQSFVTMLSTGALRKESIMAATHEVRHAALLALEITGRPGGYQPPADEGGDPPEFPAVYAIPSAYGSLAAQQIVIGAANETGTRTTFAVDTPSLNTFVYEYVTPSC
jgi:hypothetical protein